MKKIYTLLTKTDTTIMQEWSDNPNTGYFTGVKLNACEVLSICDGYVVDVETKQDKSRLITVQYSKEIFVRYINLIPASCLNIKENTIIHQGDTIGKCWKDELIFEICTTKSSKWPVRINDHTYYKCDPMPFISDIHYFDESHISDFLSASEPSLDMIDLSKITPYVITTSRNTKTLDYKKLKKIGVRAVVIESGKLFDAAHIMKDLNDYQNPNLRSQVLEALDNDILFGLWHEVRSTNLSEADLELSALKKVIQRYPPTLGVWLKLKLTKSNYTNDSILNRYYVKLVDMGLINNIGIYCTRNDISKITWKDHKDKYLLWLDEHVDKIDDALTLLNPEFFDVGK